MLFNLVCPRIMFSKHRIKLHRRSSCLAKYFDSKKVELTFSKIFFLTFHVNRIDSVYEIRRYFKMHPHIHFESGPLVSV